ncbi:ClpXP protease specificity-enhancing factor SspB [Hyphomicrobium sp. CS1GBMeth3]|uniref:SspB family protein n=1 Tax=Hyphomicrobium sp. CS1GBMeth3 TaxID=1892845 RepID=UPI000931C0D2|nr:ClpXP protease specificity-enhancing factor SspB [Hyphomicrobium sp. CS1GBMeth3]
MTVESTIDYEGLAQEAMRGVVRKVLARTAKSGLVGDHHFYISFDTEAPGVSLSRRLKEKYPNEMTIVLQHRFWDLAVTEERFEVKLTFDGIPERLVVPFDAIKVFFDPSVRFGLQFEDPNAGSDAAAQGSAGLDGLASRGATRTRKTSRPRKAPSQDGKPVSTGAASEEPATADETPPVTPLAANATKRSAAASDDEAAGTDEADAAGRTGGAEIVSLDKFRKK